MRTKPIRSSARRNTSQQVGTLPWTYFLLMVICIAVMASGFFFAALQHFSAIDLSIKNSEMRKQIEDLETERRRLWLSREMALTPVEIKKNARKLGFAEYDATIELASADMASSPAETAEPSTDQAPAARIEPAASRVESTETQLPARETRVVNTKPRAERTAPARESQQVIKAVQKQSIETPREVKKTAAVKPAPAQPVQNSGGESRPRRVAGDRTDR